MKDIRDYSLLRHNTFGIDAKCSRFLEYADATEARQVASILREEGLPFLIVGGGSNLLLTRDFEGIVVHSAMKGCEVKGTQMTCGSGMTWDEVVAMSLDAGLYGMENLSLIPGDVGASAVQNIGAYGVEDCHGQDLHADECRLPVWLSRQPFQARLEEPLPDASRLLPAVGRVPSEAGLR